MRRRRSSTRAWTPIKVVDITPGRRPLWHAVPSFRLGTTSVYALAERFAQRFARGPRASPALDPTADGRLLDLLSMPAPRTTAANRRCGNCGSGRLDPEFIRADHQHNNSRFANTVADAMADKAKVPRDELSTMIYVCWEASQALLEPLFAATDGDPAIIEQTKIMAARYLALAFAQEGRAGTG